MKRDNILNAIKSYSSKEYRNDNIILFMLIIPMSLGLLGLLCYGIYLFITKYLTLLIGIIIILSIIFLYLNYKISCWLTNKEIKDNIIILENKLIEMEEV